MIKSQLFQLVGQFSPEELSDFRLFVFSPFHNRGVFVQETKALCEYLISLSPDFDEEKIQRDYVYGIIFPGKAIVAGKIEKIMSELHKMAKDFIVTCKYWTPENDFYHTLQLATYYREHNLTKRYQYTIAQLEEEQHSAVFRDLDYFKKQSELDLEIHYFDNIYNRKRDDSHTQKALESLDLVYLSQRVRLLNLYQIQQKIAKFAAPEGLSQSILESHLPDRYADNYPVLLISYAIFRLLDQEIPDLAEFENLQKILYENEGQISPGDLKDLFTYLRNILTIQYNNGNSQVLPLLFEFQKEHFRRGYLYYEGQISSTAFISLVNTGLKLQQYGWVEELIRTQKGQIYKDSENDYFNLASAMLYFAKGSFQMALDYLPQSIKDLDYQLAAKRLELKVYFELNSELLPYKIDAFRMFISRTSQKLLSPLLEEMSTNFTNLLFQIYNVPPGDKSKIKTLLKRLEAKHAISDRDWLLEKINDLGKRR